MSISAKMVCDSISESGIRLSTIQVTMPKFILAQLNTHRMFSRNAASSRAIPTSKVIERVRNNPVVPIYWGKNKAGMSASEEVSKDDKFWSELIWKRVLGTAVDGATELNGMKVHKQITNRLLEPFMYVDVLITATDWDNFFMLRLEDIEPVTGDVAGTQPEMRAVAKAMKEVMDHSIPTPLNIGDWHLPYTDTFDLITIKDDYDTLLKCSVARCARISYLNHDQSSPDLEKDLKLYELLLKDKHLSPFEHQATPMKFLTAVDCFDIQNEDGVTHMDKEGICWSGNFKGWVQNRQLL